MNLMFLIPVVIALLIIAVIITVMSRYKRCKSDEVLVVYGKTSGKTSAKCYHGGAAFVWPVIQGYQIMSMKPMQIQCNLKSVWSKAKVKVSVPTVVTVAISTDPAIMINAAVRLLSMNQENQIETIRDIVFGQMRLVIAQMEVEELVSNRDVFLKSCMENIKTELNKLGLDLININISDITDEAEYLENQGKQAEERARNEANRQIEEQIKLGEIGVAEQRKQKEIELSKIQRDKEIQVATNNKEQAVKTAEITKEKETVTAETAKEQAVRLAEIEKDKAIEIATNDSVQKQKVAEQERLRDVEIAAQEASRDAEKAEKIAASATAQAEAKQKSAAAIAKATSESEALQVKAKQEAEAAKTKATQEREAAVAGYESDARIKKANANKDAVVNENNNSIAIAKSDAALGKERAEADRTIGQAKAESEEAVGKANAKKVEEIAKANAKAKKEELNATVIVAAEAEAERKKVEAEGIKVKAITEAEGQAKAIEEVAKAEAAKVELMKTAEAKGEQAMAEARRLYTSAETENIVNMKKAGVEDAAVISYILRDEYKLIAEADAKKFEHIQTGNVTVVGGPESAGNFMLDTAKKIQELSSIRGLIPGLGGLFGKAEEFDAKHQLTEGEDPNKGNGKGKKDPKFPEVK